MAPENGTGNVLGHGRVWRSAEGGGGRGRRLLALAVTLLVAFASSAAVVQPLYGSGGDGNHFVTYLSGEEILLVPPGGAWSSTASGSVSYSLLPVNPPAWQGWTEGFDSSPQDVPAAQWAAANGYPYSGTAPALSGFYFNATGGVLRYYAGTATTRPAALYNFTVWKELDTGAEPLYSLDFTASFFYYRSGNYYNSGAGQPHVRVTLYSPEWVPVASVAVNRTAANYVNLYASAYGGAWTPCGTLSHNTGATFTVSMDGYGKQASVSVGSTTYLTFTAYLPVKYVAITFYMNDPGVKDSTNYRLELQSASVTPKQPSSSSSLVLGNLPAGDWWFSTLASYDGFTTTWASAGGGEIDASSLIPAFNGEFDLLGSRWVTYYATAVVSSGILSFRGSGVPGGYPMSTASNVLGKPITRYAHVRYTLTAPHAGAFYFEANVIDMQIRSLPCNFYVGVAVYDTQGNAVAYCSAYAQMSSSSNSTTFYAGVQGAGPNGNTYAWSDAVTGYTLSIRRTASGAWQINLYARDPANAQRRYSAAFYPGGGYSGEIGGILIHTTERSYWDYARTDLPVSVAHGALCGEVPACASASGTFYANTTAEFAALQSGAALLTLKERPDSGGLKVTGVGEGDIVTLFRTDGSSAFNATVPAGASELTVTGVQLPFTGTIVVAGRQSARAVAQYSGALASGDTLTRSFSNQTGSYSLSKTASGGGFTGALVTGLQPGWKVSVTNGTKTYTYYANGSGAALMGTLPPGTTKTVLVYKPTVCIPDASFSGGGKYALVKEMEFPAFATASDTVFYEVSTAGYTYRVEAKVISIDVVGATSAGSFAEIKFSYKVYENGSLKPDASPILSFWGILAATQRLSNHTYTSIFSLNNCEDGILMAFEDPISGIVIKGRVLV